MGQRKNIGITIIIAAGGILLSLAMFFYLRDVEFDGVKKKFQIISEERFAAFNNVIELDQKMITAFRAFYRASNVVDRNEFEVFARELRENQSTIKALEWIPVVARESRDAYEESMRKEGYDNFQITEQDVSKQMVRAGDRSFYYPVTYLEPFKENERVLGFDLGSEDVRYSALVRARDQNALVVSERLELVQKHGKSYGVLVFLPVYKNGTDVSILESRRQHHVGFIAGVLDVKSMFDSVSKSFNFGGMDVYVYDVTNPLELKFLYGHDAKSLGDKEDAREIILSDLLAGRLIYSIKDMAFGERTWRFIFVPIQEFYVDKKDHAPFYIMFLGCVVSFLLAFLVYQSRRHLFAVEEKVHNRTYDLNELNKNLNVMAERLAEKIQLTQLQNVELQETKKVMLNILEDLEQTRSDLEKSNHVLRIQKRDIERVNLELDRFVYTASHDLRAPLRATSSFAKFLEEDYKDKLDDEGKDFINEIVQGAQRMERLIDDLLSLSRISRIKNPFEDVEIKALVDDVLLRLQYDIQKTKAVIHVPENLPMIRCDKIKITEVFANVIGNAIKFSSKDGKIPEIEMGFSRNGGFFQFFVKDNGIGIASEFHKSVFDIFRRLNKQSEFEGTGAGLSIVKRIVEDHGGQAWIESQLGQGTKIFFSIPEDISAIEEDLKESHFAKYAEDI